MPPNTGEVSVGPHETTRNPVSSGFQAVPQPLTLAEKARRYYSMVLNRMAPSGTWQAVASKLDLSEATISRAKEELERGCAVIAALGMKLVDERKVCVDPGEIQFLRNLYGRTKAQSPWLLDAGDE